MKITSADRSKSWPTPEETRELLARARSLQESDPEESARLRWRLVLAVDGLVLKAANKKARGDWALADELAQQARLHLFERVYTWDPSRGSLASWAKVYLRAGIDRGILPLKDELGVGVPMSVQLFIPTAREMIGRGQSVEEAAQRLRPGSGEKLARRLRRALESASGVVRLDDSPGLELPTSTDLPEVLDDRRRFQQIIEALAWLTPQQREVVTRRFGLLDLPRETLEIVGQSLKLSRERVRQIEKAGLLEVARLLGVGEGQDMGRCCLYRYRAPRGRCCLARPNRRGCGGYAQNGVQVCPDHALYLEQFEIIFKHLPLLSEAWPSEPASDLLARKNASRAKERRKARLADFRYNPELALGVCCIVEHGNPCGEPAISKQIKLKNPDHPQPANRLCNLHRRFLSNADTPLLKVRKT